MKTSIRLVLLLVAFCGFTTVSAVNAAPITFTVSGIASGQLGASSFSSALVTVTVHANTDGVMSETDDFDGDGNIDTFYGLASNLTTVNIAGLGTVTVLDATAIFASGPFTNVDPGENLFLQPVVVIGTLDSPPSLESFTGIAGIAGDALLHYNLATPLPPFASAGGVGYPTGQSVSTSAGSLSFNSNIGDGRATINATVPEPASLSLLATGILSLAALSRVRRRP